MRTRSRFIGPLDGVPKRRRLGAKIADFIWVNMTPDHQVITEEMLNQYNAHIETKEQAR